MTRVDFMRRHLCDVLFSMCETRELSAITATDVIREAGIARQSFYNHFSDIDDLICYAGTRAMFNNDLPLCSLDNSRRTLEYVLAHKSFYCQLPLLVRQNNYRDALQSWLKKMGYEQFVDTAPVEERPLRRLCVDAYYAGVVSVIMDWLKTGCSLPIDLVVAAHESIRPSFIRARATQTPSTFPDYPR